MTQVAVVASLAALACQGCASERGSAAPTAVAQPPSAAPKVILIIGDGMDDHQITIARNYLVGEAGRLTLDGMPQRSQVRMQTVAEEDPRLPEYVPDSANTATSMASGIVTSAGRIGTTAGTDHDAVTIMELAAAAGFGTGIVTTSSVTDATPASFVAHVNWRLCEGPRSMVPTQPEHPVFSTTCSADLKANGGKGSIAEQIAASRYRHRARRRRCSTSHSPPKARQRKRWRSRRREWLPRHRHRRRARDARAAAARCSGCSRRARCPCSGAAPATRRPSACSATTSARRLPEPFSCEPNPAFGAMPTLPAMARAALEHLDGGAGSC